MKRIMRRILCAACAAAMLVSFAGCGSSGTNSSSTGAASNTNSAASDSAGNSGSEAPESQPDGAMTKEQYASATAEDLVADIADIEHVTVDEYIALINTYQYVDIIDNEEETNYIYLADNPTNEALKLISYDAKPAFADCVETLLKSPYPQVRGYAMANLSSLFGVSDKNIELAMETLKTEEDTYVLYSAADALSNSVAKSDDVKDFIFRMADSENPKLRYRAALAIGNPWTKGVDGAVEKIIEMMSDENEYVRRVACQYSGKLADERVIEPLTAIMNDENESDDLKRYCVEGLFTLWYDYPFHENTSEKAYAATMEYFKKTPRTNTAPNWAAVNFFTRKADKGYPDWKEKAAYFDTDELYTVMTEIIKDADANWMARTNAVNAIKTHCSETQFADLKSVIDGLDDSSAHYVQDAYEKAASEEE